MSTIFMICILAWGGCQGNTNQEQPVSPPDLPKLSSKKYKVTNIKEYQEKVAELLPGDTIMLAQGIWKDCLFVFYGEGTQEKPITLTVEAYGKTTIEGNSNLKMYGNNLVVDGLFFTNGYSATEQLIEFRKGSSLTANNSVLKNCVIDSYSNPDKTKKDAWVNLWGRNNRVENCYFGTKTNLGVVLIIWPNGEGHNKNYHQITRNYFAGRPDLGVNGAETIRIGTSDYSKEVSGTIIKGNYFEYCNGETEMISIKSCENRIVENTFFECQGSVTLRHGNRNEVSANYFIGNYKANTGGVRVINEGHKIFNNYFYGCKGTTYRAPLNIMNGLPNSPDNGYHQVKDVEICFNTWVDCDLPWLLAFAKDDNQSLFPINTQIANNIVYSPNTSVLIKEYGNTKGITFSDNIAQSSRGFETGEGFIQQELSLIKDNIGYSFATSNVKSFSGFDYVITDINGRKRIDVKAIGCIDVNNNPITIEQASKINCGPLWYRKYKQ